MAKKKTKNTRTERILNIVPSKKTEDDWTFLTAASSNVIRAVRIPSSVDLRETWWKIGDQGQTGSCVGWSCADSVLRWHFTKAGLLKNDKLSVRFIWMASKETDEFNSRPTTFIEEAGTSLKSALDVARKYGCVLEQDLPFNLSTQSFDTEDTFYSKASQFKIRAYYNLHRGDRIVHWKNWLASNGPIFTALSVDDEWYNAPKGMLNKYKGPGYGGHAVAIVGYTKARFIVRNSWGTGWGDDGFAYASYAYAKAAFMESYGVALQ